MAYSFHRHASAASVAVFTALAPLTALADMLPAATGEVLLTVRGAIASTNDGDAAVFDREMLEALGAESFETTTIWTEGVQSFTGVPLNTVLDALGAEGETLRAIALNDYAVEIPVSDAEEGGPIVAYLQNGAPMSVREKGPLWVVYPYDANTAYQTEQIYSRSIWQLVSIEVLP
ncbi:molybdopterin-dependent oxidoreductase [Roseibacterium sp. SDUM158016]|uniref:molybdopterin-dependent oxidoreductase n=1 Tax=Roseicyclus sediminis TaxID=2980997 RepID=UPI0021D2251D|nr:molybdopterin-dependent oxidoreductase [Roseibacterium sp. SDUM158016]MCU4655216.1 molybdopterin-dependent oxidoreductase [Roseibacterium sp. SDUM158016]